MPDEIRLEGVSTDHRRGAFVVKVERQLTPGSRTATAEPEQPAKSAAKSSRKASMPKSAEKKLREQREKAAEQPTPAEEPSTNGTPLAVAPGGLIEHLHGAGQTAPETTVPVEPPAEPEQPQPATTLPTLAQIDRPIYAGGVNGLPAMLGAALAWNLARETRLIAELEQTRQDLRSLRALARGKAGRATREPGGSRAVGVKGSDVLYVREDGTVETLSCAQAARKLAPRFETASGCQHYVHRVDVLKLTYNARQSILQDRKHGRIPAGVIRFADEAES